MLDRDRKPRPRDYSRALAALEVVAVELRLSDVERVALERRLLGIELERRAKLSAKLSA